jgi:hypothetical protein
MTREENTAYHREYRQRPGIKEKLNQYYRLYRMLNRDDLQKSATERYHLRKLKKLNNDQSNEIPTTQQ